MKEHLILLTNIVYKATFTNKHAYCSILSPQVLNLFIRRR